VTPVSGVFVLARRKAVICLDEVAQPGPLPLVGGFDPAGLIGRVGAVKKDGVLARTPTT
jgi:hypothetical protein